MSVHILKNLRAKCLVWVVIFPINSAICCKLLYQTQTGQPTSAICDENLKTLTKTTWRVRSVPWVPWILLSPPSLLVNVRYLLVFMTISINHQWISTNPRWWLSESVNLIFTCPLRAKLRWVLIQSCVTYLNLQMIYWCFFLSVAWATQVRSRVAKCTIIYSIVLYSAY